MWHNWRVLICVTLSIMFVAFGAASEPQKSTTDIDSQLSKPQKSATDVDSPLSEPQKSATDIDSQLSKPQKSATDIDFPLPEPQKSATDVNSPLPEPRKSATDINSPLPELPKSATDIVTPVSERKEADRKASAPPLVLPVDEATKVGHKIWLNETDGNRDAITSWNANEEFASLGIGHFIWFPAGKRAPFEESFPRLLEFLRTKNVRLPAWIDKTPIPPCPWTSKADFTRNFNSPEMKQLRHFLSDTVPEQTQFLLKRAHDALDKIIESTPEGADQKHIITQFSRVANASKDLYPLIDYINFKGEGTNPAETAPDKETGIRKGWGLKQVLLQMAGTTSDYLAVRAEFADAAQVVLEQRIRNIPSNRIWETGWFRRVNTYRHPIPDQDSKFKQNRNETKRRVTDLAGR
jgi:hypothetical protein